ncbi:MULTISPECIES: hypothetical protein [unclassified Streptomyces]
MGTAAILTQVAEAVRRTGRDVTERPLPTCTTPRGHPGLARPTSRYAKAG